jgi:hypothetical protein
VSHERAVGAPGWSRCGRSSDEHGGHYLGHGPGARGVLRSRYGCNQLGYFSCDRLAHVFASLPGTRRPISEPPRRKGNLDMNGRAKVVLPNVGAMAIAAIAVVTVLPVTVISVRAPVGMFGVLTRLRAHLAPKRAHWC